MDCETFRKWKSFNYGIMSLAILFELFGLGVLCGASLAVVVNDNTIYDSIYIAFGGVCLLFVCTASELKRYEILCRYLNQGYL